MTGVSITDVEAGELRPRDVGNRSISELAAYSPSRSIEKRTWSAPAVEKQCNGLTWSLEGLKTAFAWASLPEAARMAVITLAGTDSLAPQSQGRLGKSVIEPKVGFSLRG